MPVTIRPETLADIDAVRRAVEAAFGVGREPIEARMVDALRDHGKVILSLVADQEGEIVGHVLFSLMTFEIEPPLPAVALGPLGVVPGFQKRGIGSQLVREGLEQCRLLGYGSVFLLGNPAYYKRFGFIPAHRLNISAVTPPRIADAFQVIELTPDALDGVTGVAREAPEFDLT